MSTLKQTVQDAVKNAMRAKDATRLGTLRMLTAAIKQVEIDTQTALDNQGIISVIRKMIKQRKDAIDQYHKGGRDDLAQAEAAEIEILSAFLPASLSTAEIDALIDSIITETQASTLRDLKKVMPLLQERINGRADMGEVSARVKARLSA